MSKPKLSGDGRDLISRGSSPARFDDLRAVALEPLAIDR